MYTPEAFMRLKKYNEHMYIYKFYLIPILSSDKCSTRNIHGT